MDNYVLIERENEGDLCAALYYLRSKDGQREGIIVENPVKRIKIEWDVETIQSTISAIMINDTQLSVLIGATIMTLPIRSVSNAYATSVRHASDDDASEEHVYWITG